jgi:hypothetical protein
MERLPRRRDPSGRNGPLSSVEAVLSDERRREAVHHYEVAWNIRDDAARLSALEIAWAEHGAYVDDDVPDGVIGRAELSALIAAEHAETPGLVISTTRPLVLLGDRGWLQWESWSTDGTTLSGTDFIEFAADGRIERLTDFVDP